MVNKFLHPNGGAETYVFRLGEYLEKQGHDVQYFGMEHKGRCVGNTADAYTRGMDFHQGSIFSKLIYPIKTIYSVEARKKIRKVLDDFKPDVCHLNNFNYQLTPAIILEIVKWRNQVNRECKIVYTAHDYQLVCPNHMLYNPGRGELCEKCVEKNAVSCFNGKCIHDSKTKSLVGTIEKEYWKMGRGYRFLDVVICPSQFVKRYMDKNALLKGRTIVIHNFVSDICDNAYMPETLPERYVLYFGRYSKEKGVGTLLQVCRTLQNIPFVFAGTGSLEPELSQIDNITNVGFRTPEELWPLVKNAAFTVCPSEWYEVFGLSIVESIKLGTPVLGSNIGAIPEVIKDNITGKLFEPGNVEELTESISAMWDDDFGLENMSRNCGKEKLMDLKQYYDALQEVYGVNV